MEQQGFLTSASFRRLNAKQQEAVCYGEGPLLILAGAGSGKTSTMAHRIAFLIRERGLKPDRILGLSFTQKAARELRERVAGLVGFKKNLRISTFHKFALDVLRYFGPKAGLVPPFVITDETDQLECIKQLLRQFKYDDRAFCAFTLKQEFSRAKTEMPQDLEKHFFEDRPLSEEYAAVCFYLFPAYNEALQFQKALDFDDILLNTVKMLDQYPEIKADLASRLDHILVDEYQDTNPIQFKMLESILKPEQNLCVVGDDDQSIYAFRGATPQHILHFEQHFPRAKRIELNQNYRSVNSILKLANAVITGHHPRFEKTLWSTREDGEVPLLRTLSDDRQEAQWVADEIRLLLQENRHLPQDIAILVRSNVQTRLFEETLRKVQVPYELIGGFSFFERKEIKDSVAYLRLLVNPLDDFACRRILNWPTRGFGKKTMEALHFRGLQEGIPFMQLCVEPEALELSSKVKAALKAFADMFEKKRQLFSDAPPQGLEVSRPLDGFFEQLGIREALFDEQKDPKVAARKWENIQALVMMIAQWLPDKNPKNGLDWLEQFLIQIQLDQHTKNDEEQKPAVRLQTLHSAKGLEFERVYLVGCEEGILPHKRVLDGLEDLSEERRLFYVGITRAKTFLTLTRAENRLRYGKPQSCLPSRFVKDLPDEILQREHTSFVSTGAHEAKVAKLESLLKLFGDI